MNKLQCMVQGRVVAIVGNAQSIVGKKQGHIIDSCDVVIRINLWPPKESEWEDVGKRTDINYVGAWIWDECWGFAHKKPEWERTGLVDGVPTLYKNMQIHSELGGATTGLICIYDCLGCGPKELKIFGFDCLRSPDRYSLEDRHNQPKDIVDVWDKSLVLLSNIILENKHVTPDDVLFNVIHTPPVNTPLSRYVRNKTVSIVGSAQSILEHGSSEEIEKRDVVIRMNMESPVDIKHSNRIGTRTDIRYNNNATHEKFNDSHELEGIPINAGHRWEDKLTYRFIQRNYSKLIDDGEIWCPMSGITCAMMCVLSGAKEVYITGYDFYRSGNYQSGQVPSQYTNHKYKLGDCPNGKSSYNNTLKDEACLRQMCKDYPVIKLDRILQEIIYGK